MKKRFVFLLGCLIAGMVLTMTACGNSVPEENRAVYDISVRVEGEQLVCEQTTTYTNAVADKLDSVVFAVYPCAYTEGAADKAYVGELPDYATVTFDKIESNGVETEPTFEGAYMTLPIDLARGESATFSFRYTLGLPTCALRFGLMDGYYNLSGFYPQIAVYGEDGFRTDRFSTVGDPILSDPSDFTIRLDIPDVLVAATPFTFATAPGEEGRKILTATEKNVRDFAVVLKEGYKEYLSDADGIAVRYYSLSDDAQARCDLAADAIKTFAKAFGGYPYNSYTVAETTFDADGMEFSGMAYVAANASDFTRAIIHETAHQWWYNIVGSDNIFDAYLDEGLTAFVTEYYALLDGREEDFEQGMSEIRRSYARYERMQKMRKDASSLDMTRPIYEYTEYRYVMLVYDKAALMFDALYRLGGREKFNKALSIYYRDNYFGRANKDDLIAAFNAGFGADVTGLIEGFLSDGAVVTTFAS
ncbi:MAG: M1 family metallopeptidase [Clostridia bacterium]|nr:M1 family metallopeptidase [Clostridia bacterium]